MKRFKRVLCVVAAVVLSCAPVLSCVAGGDGISTAHTVEINDGVTMRVLWTVSGFHIGRNAEWGESEARRMLFKPLDVSASTIVFDGQRCDDVVFSREEVNAAQYFEKQYQTTLQDLGLSAATLTVIRTDCPLPGFKEYVRLPDRKLIVEVKGVLFIFEPAVNY